MAWKSAALVASSSRLGSFRLPGEPTRTPDNHYRRGSNAVSLASPGKGQPHQTTRHLSHGSNELDTSYFINRSQSSNDGDQTKSILKIFLEKTTEIFSLQNIINLAFVLAICLVCFQQCSTTIRDYLKYQTRVYINTRYPDNQYGILPGLTICNNNRMIMNDLVQQYPELGEKLEELKKNTSLTRDGLLLELKKILDKTVDMNKLLYQSSISELMKLSNHSEFITRASCNPPVWGRKIDCDSIPYYRSFQSSNCFTIFYQGGLIGAAANPEVYKSENRGKTDNELFTRGTLAEIEVNFQPYEYTDFQRDVGGQLVIHSPRNVGSVRDIAYNILPGYRNRAKFESKTDMMYPSVELDKTTCVRNCILTKTIESCNCWPVEVPYYYGDTTFDKNQSLILCPWGGDEDGILTNTTATIYFDCYKRFSDMCRRKCLKACESYKYTIKTKATEWVTKADQAFITNRKQQRRELVRKYSSALIILKYNEYEATYYIYYPLLSLAQLVSNLGGIISSLIGISAITIYRYVTRQILGCQVENQI